MYQTPHSKIQYILAIGSGKGGVGKSATAMNVAVSLSLMGKNVGLLDGDIYGPSQGKMMNLANATVESETSGETQVMIPPMQHGVKVLSLSMLMEDEAPIIWRGPMASSALMQMVTDGKWEELDVLIIDLPPGTGDIQLTLSQKLPLSGAVIVSTPQDVAWLDARRGLEMFKKVNVPVLGLVENMSSFVCPHCHEESHPFSHGGVAKAAEELNIPLLAQIPLDIEIREGTDNGKPLCLTNPESPQAEIYKSLAENVWQALEERASQKTQTKVQFEEAS